MVVITHVSDNDDEPSSSTMVSGEVVAARKYHQPGDCTQVDLALEQGLDGDSDDSGSDCDDRLYFLKQAKQQQEQVKNNKKNGTLRKKLEEQITVLEHDIEEKEINREIVNSCN